MRRSVASSASTMTLSARCRSVTVWAMLAIVAARRARGQRRRRGAGVTIAASGPVAQLVRAGDSSERCLRGDEPRSGRDEFRETGVGAPASIAAQPQIAACERIGNPEPSRRYTAGRCRDYLRASVLLITGASVPHPTQGDLGGEEIVRF